MLVRLIYASRVDALVNHLQVRDILARSRRNNTAAGVTGALVFTGGVFLQYLEGHRAAVNATYHRILRDPRHRDPALLLFEEIDWRRFGDWNMGYLGITDTNRRLFLKYSPEAEFDPYSMRAAGLVALFDELVGAAKWLERSASEAGAAA
jgi:hypothetical protein